MPKAAPPPIVLGITGGVASGKSTVANEFARLGAVVVDSDLIARELLAPGSDLARKVIAHFGPDFAIKGSAEQVDRARLAHLVFSDERSRRELGAIMHPPIHAELVRRIDAGRRAPGTPLVAAEIPLLFENRLEAMVDRVVVVTCGEREQVRRLIGRRPGLSAESALAQVRSQIPLAEKSGWADDTIDSEQPPDTMLQQVRKLFESLRRSPASGTIKHTNDR